MKTYCEITQDNNYALQEIPAKVLLKLAALLNQIADDDFEELLAAINSEMRQYISTYFAEAGQHIVFCKKCQAVGRIKNDDKHRYDKFEIDNCPTCGGEGTRVKKYFVLYEKIDQNKRKRFAINGYTHANTPTE